ncbi:MAG: DNA polymerase [Nitrospiraceae bacterium]
MTWTPPSAPPNLSGERTLYVDLETRDEGLKDLGPGWPWGDGYIVGAAIATADKEWYFPFRHPEGNCEWDVDRWLYEEFYRTRNYVFFNAPYDVGWGRTKHWLFRGTLHDALFGTALLDENRDSYSLDNITRDLFGTGKDTSIPEEERKNIWKMHSKDVGPYAETDVRETRRLHLHQLPLLKQQGLMELYEMECELIRMLVDMRERGIRIDVPRAEELWQELFALERTFPRKFRTIFGVNIPSPSAKKEIVLACDELGIQYPLTELGNPSIKGKWIDAQKSPFLNMLKEFRHVSTIRGLCLEGGILKHLHGDRIYPNFHPLKQDDGGTVTGRFSASKPNPQQASGRTELGLKVREVYLPEEGEVWNCADYSQQEPRLTVHYAVRASCTKADRAAQEMSEEGADFHQIAARMCGISRDRAKPIGLGIIYGEGTDKLCEELGLSRSEGQRILDKYHARAPFMRELSRLCNNTAQTRGYVQTLMGRRCRFNLWEPDEYVAKGRKRPKALPLKEAEEAYPGRRLRRAFTFKALNSVIQGSAGDMGKKAMVNLYREGIVPMIPMHDEFNVSSPGRLDRIAEIMIDAVKLEVPVRVDMGVGKNWKEAKA